MNLSKYNTGDIFIDAGELYMIVATNPCEWDSLQYIHKLLYFDSMTLISYKEEVLVEAADIMYLEYSGS